MIDVNLLPRELTGHVGYVCWQWFERHFSRDEVPYIRGGACGLVPDLRDNLIDVVQNCFADGGLDDETVGRFVALYATLPFDVDEARRLAENDFRYVADADTRLAFELCVLGFDAMFPQHVEVRQTDVDGTLEHIAFPASWQHDLAVSSTPENRMSAYRNGLSAVRKAYDLTPAGIIKQLNLLNPIYSRTAAGGHFGREDFPWENVEHMSDLAAYIV